MAEHIEAVKASISAKRRSILYVLIALAVIAPIQAIGVREVHRRTPEVYSDDFKSFYLPTAKNILNGNGPRMPDGKILVHAPPGYPYYTAVVLSISRARGVSIDMVTDSMMWIGNVLWNALCVAAMMLLAHRLAGVGLAVFTGLTVGFYPPVFYLSQSASPQTPFIALLAWSLYFLYIGHETRKVRWFALAGGVMGLAGLFQPVALVMLATLLVYMLIFFRGSMPGRLAGPAVMLGAFLLVIAPWSIYVYVEQQQIIILGDVASSHLAGISGEPSTSDGRGISGFNNFRELVHDPLGHSFELLRRAGKCWYHTDSGLYEREALIANLPFGLLLLLGLVPALKSSWRWGAGLVLAIFLGAWATSALTIYLTRYLMTGIIIAGPIMAIAPLWVYECRHRARAPRLDSHDEAV
jgi:4-amino-4-deoxy-L-arabinose transferase-like glycosyltransferase